MKIEKILYSAQATSTGGRDGVTKSSDGVLNLQLTTPAALGGMGAVGTNPEQLFAAGYSACFIGAIKYESLRQNLVLPNDLTVKAEVGIGTGAVPAGFGIQVTLTVSIPGMEQAAAENLVHDADKICPYSNATRGNIDVTFVVAPAVVSTSYGF
jgi:lipoyl-dependent peroxiredoxin